MTPAQNLLDHLVSQCQSLRDQGYFIFGIHQDSIVMAVSPDAERHLGYRMEDMLGMNAWKLFDPSSFEVITEHLFNKESTVYDAVAITQDGTRFAVRLNIIHTSVEGETVRLVGYQLL